MQRNSNPFVKTKISCNEIVIPLLRQKYPLTTEHVGEIVMVSLILTKGLEFENWERSHVMW